MQFSELFYPWVPRFVRYGILTMLLFIVLCANGVYAGITGDIYNNLGVYQEPFTMALNAVYIGMAAGFLIQLRLATRFTNKTMVLAGLIIVLLMNVICALTSSPIVFIAAVLVLGFGKILMLGEIYIAWLKTWSKNFDRARFYPMLYFTALGGLYFMSWVTASFSKIFSWRYSYIVIIIFIIINIILALIFTENHKLKRRVPLYQLDLPGLGLFVLALMLINYIFVYGKVEDWFASKTICAAFAGVVISALLFIRREMIVKRPILDLAIFKKPNFSFGILLFMLGGVFFPTSLQANFSGPILGFESIRNQEINLYLLPGFLAAAVLTYFWYRNNYNGHLLIIAGFASLVLYYAMMYCRFVNDLNINEFWLPSILKGFGQCLLYVSIGLYASAGFDFTSSLKVVGTLVMVRSFLAPGFFSGFYNYYVYAEKTRHLTKLASGIDAYDPLVLQHTDLNGFYRNIQTGASLGALKEISGAIIVFGLLVITILIVINVYKMIHDYNRQI
jgi:DHA2 family multidrug resistance protein